MCMVVYDKSGVSHMTIGNTVIARTSSPKSVQAWLNANGHGDVASGFLGMNGWHLLSLTRNEVEERVPARGDSIYASLHG